jgi:hypothetical protein
MKFVFAIVALSGLVTGCSLLAPDARAGADPRYSAYPTPLSPTTVRDAGVVNMPSNTGNSPQDINPYTMQYGYMW